MLPIITIFKEKEEGKENIKDILGTQSQKVLLEKKSQHLAMAAESMEN